MKIALEILGILIAVGSFVPYVRSDVWMIRGWDFPRLQLFVAGSIVFGAMLWIRPEIHLRDLATPVALGLALLVQVYSMRRYTRVWKPEVLPGDEEHGLKLMISNVLMTNRRSADLIALVREYRPDLLIALETDQWWTDQLAVLSDDYPHAVEIPQDDTYGMVVRSRIPLIEPKVEHLVRANIPSVHAAIELGDGTRVRLHAVHPKPPFPDEDTSSTDRDAELLLVGKRVKKTGGPSIVLGDLNDVAWSRTTRLFQKISGLLDPRIGRGFFSTFHAGHWWMRWPLDHIFISDHFRIRGLKRLPSVGSDHFPMFADLAFNPAGKHQQDAPEADGEDEEDAEEKIADARKAASPAPAGG